ncbi:DNA polymerase-3 subunit epsilon [Catalinimonas alkaloidigena]|uniref:3'-5' exonuclease n=1 Tax=Catalinimonas alkaloidigena TaxID=1075417 RepID=UPI0024055548|nr:3'-5' exonuclease [Catalinimonas alkaloidigena]MDF9800326.1 DNA polymerase-3 subunit epsilon [Catalinimonas alkaloidigena]
MRDYLLFVDTETSGIPKDWDASYADNSQWPYIVQLAWVVYTQDGQFVKEENYYIRDDDFEISRASQEIHGISRSYLLENGHSRYEVMQQLKQDLEAFQPLLIGHYVKLDYHMLGVEFFRTQLDNPIPALPAFCTMKATNDYIRYPFRKYLSLGELYKRLTQKPLAKPHNALTDAQATATCFFIMREREDLNEEKISRQEAVQADEPSKTKNEIYVYIILALLFFMLLIFFLL